MPIQRHADSNDAADAASDERLGVGKLDGGTPRDYDPAMFSLLGSPRAGGILAVRPARGRVPLALLISSSVLGSLGCRPEGYVAPAAPVEAKPSPPEDPEELTHQALYGEDLASPAVLIPPEDATITPTGLTQLTLKPGTGKVAPGPDDTVVMNYRGWDARGQRFDDTQDRGKPDRIKVAALAPGWAEALSTMVSGEKRRLWIPARLGFGPAPAPDRPPGDVVLDVELLDVIPALPPPEVPADLTQPPSDARTTSTGLVYKLLERGEGQKTPQRSDRVLVHYSGWDMSGRLFDSSVMRGEPITFGVDEVIPGWTEALQLMHEGDKMRVWIPGNLAYGDEPKAPGMPAGRLCFDVHLIQIQ